MEVLRFISQYSYWAYLVVGGALLVVIVLFLKKFKTMMTFVNGLQSGISTIQANLLVMEEKEKIVERKLKPKINLLVKLTKYFIFYRLIKEAYKHDPSTKGIKGFVRSAVSTNREIHRARVINQIIK
ncbi:hypothetical protein EII25_00890 [Erysipelotrichaceae bacterium OH741_COT-311]|nr:hypothetical protein EII25_00890 [Erysipelotrichaceae bacterium OH741_COT-311]